MACAKNASGRSSPRGWRPCRRWPSVASARSGWSSATARPEKGRRSIMMTIVTRVTLREGSEPEWDGVMRERLAAAREQPGWLGGQLMIPPDGLNQRVIVGCWQTRADWEAWHNDPAFQERRRQPAGRPTRPDEPGWPEGIAAEGASRPPA